MNHSTDGGLSPSEWLAVKKDILTSLHCAMPGTVETFDPGKGTAEIRPAASGFPLLRDVPVFMPVPFEVNPGDACLVVFADYDTDAWQENGETGEPRSGRRHSLSDAFAFVGFRKNPRTIQN
ncbi:Gp138 family membrane-puncturing spike protein [Aristaeella lactis]|uniref:Uncharacterized protein n=1 Tax=Aristaeella lactis TaxID=3046383 RepID=A0AC61PKR8_9FIRM|nr:Gp138 family membrane-puncturing spike protein [Aristaeella lactis]QUA52029.1 hypothetical protein JYE50_09905 [Aristaeella lactis]SMC56816.1 hypothetical protein SAMN06297397_1402 [Aristaeella lactis]